MDDSLENDARFQLKDATLKAANAALDARHWAALCTPKVQAAAAELERAAFALLQLQRE